MAGGRFFVNMQFTGFMEPVLSEETGEIAPVGEIENTQPDV